MSQTYSELAADQYVASDCWFYADGALVNTEDQHKTFSEVKKQDFPDVVWEIRPFMGTLH